eukprot:gi/632984995/ref/XP_007909433.1/ PREDICTED: death-inducer obliterator 1 isoform X2 [Callorhinchus milii]
MLSDKDPLLPSSSTPFRLELQTEASETPDLKLDDVGANISATAENENAELSGLQESSQNSNNSESNVANSNRKSPRLHSVAANNKDHNKAEPSRIIHPSSKEFKKTWGFRQTTIAKRESALDAEASDTLLNENSDQQAQLTLRRSRRQTQRTARVQEFISAAQKRYRRTSGFDEGGEFLSIASEVEAGSDGSIDAVEEKGPDSIIDLGSDSLVEEINEESISDKGSSTNSDSDELTLKELQNQLRKRRVQERCDSPQTTQLVQEISSEENQSKKGTKLAGIVKPKKLLSTSVKKGSKSSAVPKDSEQLVKKELKLRTSIKSETEEDESSVSQSDNDYNDPDKLYCICRQPHNNRFMICCDRCEEWFHGDCVGITMARGRLLERNGEDYICPDCSPSPDKGSSSTEMTSGQQESKSALASTGDQNAALEKPDGSSPTDQGIKGRIEKAANPSGKKKIKIFKPMVEIPGVPKCIGPGCTKLASTDSVYCSNDCILKHAAATMKSLSQAKEQKLKTKEKNKPKPEKATSSKSLAEVKSTINAEINSKQLPSGPRKAIEGTDTNETSSKKLVVLVHNRPVAIPKESAAGPALGTWTIDHNYNAVKPEKTVISTSVFYKSLQKEGDTNVDSLSAGERSTGERHILPKPPPTSQQASKPPTPANKQLGSKRPITTTQQSPSSKQPSSTKQLSTKQPGPANKQLTSATPSGKKSADRQSVQLSAPGAKPSSQPSNSQIRHNIRRSLKEILCKRVNDCDDLDVTEEVIGKIAVNIEKELFMLFRETDSKYKSRYRCIMFNLKNPRNQGLFRRVLQEQIVPSRLVRMSPEEIESKELAMWGEKESRSAREQSARLQRETKRPASRVMNKSEVDLEEAPPMSDADEDSRPAQKNSAPLPDILSLMLKDTTDEHRAHLFDLNCRICTGKIQVSDDEPVPKKPKVVVTKKTEPKPKPREEWRHRPELDKPAVTVSAAQVTAVSTQVTSSLCIASVASFSISKDTSQISSVFVTSSPAAPASSECATAVINTAPINTTSKLSPSTHPEIKSAVPQYSSAVPAAAKGVKLTDEEKKPEALKSILTTATPKSILSKPSAASEKTCTMSSAIRVSSELRSSAEVDTSLFLSHLDAIWKGFINMHGVAKFVTKAYPVSGSIDYLVEDLPDTIHIGGRISPHTVWDYVSKLKSSLSKEVCLIRFHPATEEEEVTYVSLYSYFNSRGRFGVVANNARHIKDLYLIPLAAKDPIPSKLLPFEGPGLEKSRPNVILGLVIRQRGKRREPEPEDKPEATPSEEKRGRLGPQEDGERKTAKPSTTPPGSPPHPAPSGSGPAPAPAPAPAATPNPTPTPASATPLQHILQTLFGAKKAGDRVTEATLLDPIVQQFGRVQEGPPVEDDDNRPYDPEEEYKPEGGAEGGVYEPEKVYDLEEAYDPADETILEEVMVALPPGAAPAPAPDPRHKPPELYPPPPSLVEQQKMLETLNKQIEEQTRQVEEQEEALRQQRAAVGVSMACFSVSDALMSPPPKPPGFKAELFSGAEVSQVIDQRRDPRQAGARRVGSASPPVTLTPGPEQLQSITAHCPQPREEGVATIPPNLGTERLLLEAPQPPPVLLPEAMALAVGPGDGLPKGPPPKGLLPTPNLPPLFAPSYTGGRCTFPSPPHISPQDHFHSPNLQIRGNFPNFQHLNSQQFAQFGRQPSDFMARGPLLAPPPLEPPPLFGRGGPTARLRFQGHPPGPGFQNHPPHPLVTQPPPQQEGQQWAMTPGSAPKPLAQATEGETPRSVLSYPQAEQRDTPRDNAEPRTQQPARLPDRSSERTEPRSSSDRFRRTSDDRRRDRDRDYGKSWDRDRERTWNRERNRERDRERDRDKGKNRERERDQERDRYRRRERDRSRSRDRDKDRNRDRERDRGRERDRDRERDRGRGRERERRERSRSKEPEKDKQPDVEKESKKLATGEKECKKTEGEKEMKTPASETVESSG